MNLEFSRQIFEKYSNIKFHENLYPLEREVFHGVREMDNRTERQTDVTNLIVAFRNFADSPKNASMWSGSKLKNKYI